MEEGVQEFKEFKELREARSDYKQIHQPAIGALTGRVCELPP
jgi:hypothetical protein